MVIFLKLDTHLHTTPPVNKQQFIQYLRNPGSMTDESLSQLEDLVVSKPYFQGAHTLLAKGSMKLKSKNSPSKVARAAVYATDRVLLKKFINDELIFLTPLSVHESHEPDLERDLSTVIKDQKRENAQFKTSILASEVVESKSEIKEEIQAQVEPNEVNVPKVDSTNDQLSYTAPTSSELDALINEIYQDLSELKVNRAKLRAIENQLAEDEAVDNAVKKATQKSEQRDKVELKSEVKPLVDVKKASQSRSARVSSAKPIDSPDEVVPEKKASKGVSPKKKTPTKEVKSKEISDIAKKALTKLVSKKPQEDTSKKPSEEIAKGESKDEPKKKSLSNSSKKSEQDEIISYFIETNPSIPKGATINTVKIDDLAGESTVLHPDISSEYLAEIYLEQGHKDRAIQIYEALMVRFPEKSIYFAAIIKKLNQSS
ncbi:MAG: hypothetical protein ACJAVY_001235 [Marinoscillum sp.]